MATNFNSVASSSSSDSTESPSLPLHEYECKLFVESFPKLSVANIYVLSSRLTHEATISAHGSRIHIPSLNIGSTISGVTFESVMCKPLQAFRNHVGQFRLIIQPPNQLSGSGRAEILSRNFQNEAQDVGITNLLKSSLNDVSLIEHNPYYLKCRMCDSVLSDSVSDKGSGSCDNIIFTKIRPLPGSNWEEYANDLWFCHAPHPPGHGHSHTSSTNPVGTIRNDDPNSGQGQGAGDCFTPDISHNITQNLAQVAITPSSAEFHSLTNSLVPEPEQSAFAALQAPAANACYYGPCYWAVNPLIFPRVSRQSAALPEKTVNLPALCSGCQSEIGIFSTEHCLILWDFGVEWMHALQTMRGTQSQSRSKDRERKLSFGSPAVNFSRKEAIKINAKARDNFKKAIFAALHEWSFSLTCKLLVKSTSEERALFLWNIDRNLTIYKATLHDNNKYNVINPQKVAKFMFCSIKNGELENENPFDEQVYKNGGTDHQISVPDAVLENGLRILDETSEMYLTPPESLKCGFLDYSYNLD